MKNFAFALALSLPTLGLAAKSLPNVPANCLQDIQMNGYCADFDAPIFMGPVNIRFFIVVDKADYPTVDSAIARYMDFASWPEFVMDSGRSNIEFHSSSVLSPIPAVGSRPEIIRHYANYRLKAPIVGWQDVRVVTHNYKVAPYQNALASLEFEVQNRGAQQVPVGESPLMGSEGVKSQTGSVHAVDCKLSNLCNDNQHLLIYHSKISPDIDILPKVAAGAIQEGVEAIIVGMFFSFDNDDDEIL